MGNEEKKQLEIDFADRKRPKLCSVCGGIILKFLDYAECINRGWECSTIYHFQRIN